MRRSKQQAVMFLLGATLVGGVIGATADRILLTKKPQRSWGVRGWMYDDLGLNEQQRQAIDSVLEDANRVWKLVLASRRQSLDSITASTDQSIRGLLTADQRAQLDSTVAAWRERMKQREAEREAERESQRQKQGGRAKPDSLAGGKGTSAGPTRNDSSRKRANH